MLEFFFHVALAATCAVIAAIYVEQTMHPRGDDDNRDGESSKKSPSDKEDES